MRNPSATLSGLQTSSSSSSSTTEHHSFKRDTASASFSFREYSTCLHGFLLGLCIEGGLALGLYGLYYIGHTIK